MKYIITQVLFTLFLYVFLCLTFLTFDLWSLYCSIDNCGRAFCLVLFIGFSGVAHCIRQIVELGGI